MSAIQIRHRHTDAVLFECEVPAGLESGLQMRHALEQASAARANLAWANLAWANLAWANLARAYLARAYLARANLAGATFGDGVTASRGVLQVLGLRWVVTVFDAHMLIGCQMHSLDDWAAFDDRQIAAMDGAHALRFWRQHKTKLLALGQREDVSA